jgi:hypothetical protein
MTLHFHLVEEPSMTAPPLTGASALKFLNAIEGCLKEAGGGQNRAFNLIIELDKIGLDIVARDLPPVSADQLDI